MANPNKRSAFTKILNFIDLNSIKGPRGLHYLSYVKFFQKNILGAFTKIHADYDDIASFPWPMNSVIIYSPELAKSVLVENSKNYIKGEQIEELRAVIGNGLATNNNYDSWLKSRALLAREFNNKSIAHFLSKFDEISLNQIQSWKEASFDICEEMKLMTFNIACETLLGMSLSSDDAQKVNEAVHFTSQVTYERIFKLFPIPYWVPRPKNIMFNRHYNNLNDIVLRLIREEKKNLHANGKSVLQKLVHAKDPDTKFSFSEEELRDEVLTMLLAGHETSAHTLTWIFGLLAKNQQVQEKLYQDIKEKPDLPPSDFLEELPYLKWVINESMRLYPAFPVLSRKASANNVLGQYQIPKNTNVVIPIFVMQRDERNWERPLEFMPERFCHEGAEKSYAFLPFSRGPRRCIAELFAMTEISIIIVNVLRNFHLSLATENNELPEAIASVSLKPKDGMPLKITKRL